MQILVDSSVWIDHLRSGDDGLAAALQDNLVFIHPHIIGELALGSLRNRRTVLDLLSKLPTVKCATDDEVLALIEQRQLYSRGIGFTDCHLIAATLLNPPLRLWTRDKRLRAVVESMALCAEGRT